MLSKIAESCQKVGLKELPGWRDGLVIFLVIYVQNDYVISILFGVFDKAVGIICHMINFVVCFETKVLLAYLHDVWIDVYGCKFVDYLAKLRVEEHW